MSSHFISPILNQGLFRNYEDCFNHIFFQPKENQVNRNFCLSQALFMENGSVFDRLDRPDSVKLIRVGIMLSG